MHEKKKQQLITMGKAKGFLTYDEVNDALPESIVSTDQIDDWLSTLGEEGIEIVDDGDITIATVVAPTVEEAKAATGAAEPEVVAAKGKKDESAEDKKK